MFAQTTEHQNSWAMADYLISASRERGELLTPLKLQKLLFYADAWHMALYGDEATTERFQAWVHGPVALTQYHRFKEYRWRPITEEIERPDISDELAHHLDEIIDVFGSETATALEIMTHQEEPWLRARGGIPDDQPCNNYIDKDLTRNFYGAIAEED